MRLVLASPLYPPDIAEPAPYVKELARRLGAAHEVTIVTYGRLPEQVPGAGIIAVDKRQMLAVRLVHYFLALRHATREADIIYAQNGPSVELPLWLISSFARVPIIMHIGDEAAHRFATKSFFRSLIERLAFGRARAILEDTPPARPEILPFAPAPTEELAGWERAWEKHVEKLQTLFTHGN